MSVKNHNKAESMKSKWVKQRSGEDVSPSGSSAVGSHFAKPAPAPAPTSISAPTSASASNAVPVPQGSRFAGGSGQPSGRRVGQPNENMMAAQAPVKRNLKIVGISGEMPAVQPRISQSRGVSYSRYNNRYVNRPAELNVNSIIDKMSPEDARELPAMRWAPFAMCGGVNAAVAVLWCILAITAFKDQVNPGFFSVVGLMLLCCSVVSALVTLGVTMSATEKMDRELDKNDILASAIVKAGAIIAVQIVVWVVAMAVSSSLAV